MPSARKTWSWVLRAAVCLAAVVYLYTQVSWYDTAILADDPGRAYRVLGRGDDDPLWLEDPRDGRPFSAPPSALARPAQAARFGRHPIEPGLRSVVRRIDPGWAAWALAVLAPTTFILAWRLRYLLRTQGMGLSAREALLLTFAGNFFNFALPGTTGGDVYKAYHVSRRAPRRTEAVTVVILDRVMGLVSFVLLAAGCLLISWRKASIGRLGKVVGLLLAALMVGAAIFFSRRFRRWIGYESLLRRLPMADRLRRIDQTAFSFRWHPRATFWALLMTCVNNFLLAGMILCVARAMGMPPGAAGLELGHYAEFYLASVLALSAGYLLAAVPISVQGFGLLESVFLRVFVGGQWGTASQVVALCLGARVAQLAWALPGIIVPWLGLGRPPPEAAEELAHAPAARASRPAG